MTHFTSEYKWRNEHAQQSLSDLFLAHLLIHSKGAFWNNLRIILAMWQTLWAGSIFVEEGVEDGRPMVLINWITLSGIN